MQEHAPELSATLLLVVLSSAWMSRGEGAGAPHKYSSALKGDQQAYKWPCSLMCLISHSAPSCRISC